MHTLTITAHTEPRSPARVIGVTTMAAALALVALSAVLPWVTVFRGLQPVPGFALEGGPLAGALILALGLVVGVGVLGWSTWLKVAAGLIGAAVAFEALLLQSRILDFVADPGPAGPLTQPTAGVGAGVLAVAAALVVVTAVTVPAREPDSASPGYGRLVLAIGLFVAGWIHLLLVPEHLGESTVLGLGFLAAAAAQLALAGIVLWRPSALSLALVVALNVTLIAIYAYAVLVGLPFGTPDAHAEAVGLVVGAGEPIDGYGAVSKVAEVVSLAIAFALLGPRPRQARADGQPPRATAQR